MTTDNKKPQSLATKLAAIGKEIGAIDKSGKNTQQNYNYIEYGVVAGKIRELFDKYNVIIVPNVDDIEMNEVKNKYGSVGYHYTLKMTFLILNGDNDEDREIASWAGEAIDYGDKGINKAETSGTKYFLMRLFNVSEKSDEDNDKNTPPEMVESKSPVRRHSDMEIAQAKLKLGVASSLTELKAEYAKLGALAFDSEVVKYKDEMKAKLLKEEQNA